MEYVKKSLGGYKPDSAGDYVVLSWNEYQSLKQSLEKLESNYQNAKHNHMLDQRKKDQELYNIMSEANRRIESLENKANALETENAELKATAADVKQLQQELEVERGLNFHLKRIARERANQVRGIRNKKQHDGYLAISSQQHTEHWTEEQTLSQWREKNPDKHSSLYNKIEHHYDTVWKTIIQTPHEASVPFGFVEMPIKTMLWNTDPVEWNEEEEFYEDRGLLIDFGCDNMVTDAYNGTMSNYDPEKNVCYKWTFAANYKSGFWEVTVYTTQSLYIPDIRRPRK